MDDLSEDYKHESLALIMFLKEKWYETIKGSRVADKRKKWEKIQPREAKYPTVSTEADTLTTEIDTLKGIDVAVVDIPGAYLSANMDDEVYVVLKRKSRKVYGTSYPE